MKRDQFEGICRAVKSGEEKFLENLETRYTGRIVSCGEERFEVDVSGKRESWSMEQCMETMGSKYHHKEKTLDTHPWDTDRFNPYT